MTPATSQKRQETLEKAIGLVAVYLGSWYETFIANKQFPNPQLHLLPPHS